MLEEVKKWKTYKKDKPLKKKSNARLQFRNWMKNASKWNKDKPSVNLEVKKMSDEEKEEYYRKKGYR